MFLAAYFLTNLINRKPIKDLTVRTNHTLILSACSYYEVFINPSPNSMANQLWRVWAPSPAHNGF